MAFSKCRGPFFYNCNFVCSMFTMIKKDSAYTVNRLSKDRPENVTLISFTKHFVMQIVLKNAVLFL